MLCKLLRVYTRWRPVEPPGAVLFLRGMTGEYDPGRPHFERLRAINRGTPESEALKGSDK